MEFIDKKHISHKYRVDACIDTYDGGMRIKFLSSILINPADCCESAEGVAGLTRLLKTKQKVEIDKYDNFDIIRVGKPKTLYLVSDADIEACENALSFADLGFMAYWDSECLAFITNDCHMERVLINFLKKVKKVKYYTKPNRKLRIQSHSLFLKV